VSSDDDDDDLKKINLNVFLRHEKSVKI